MGLAAQISSVRSGVCGSTLHTGLPESGEALEFRNRRKF
jgi:hypothetical protein